MPLIDWLCCACCQYPGCCCGKRCKFNPCAADIVVCAKYCPCMVCCRVKPEKVVFLAGLSGSGKTALLYYLVLHKIFEQADPTKGFNYEQCTFNKWQTYEFWDPGGSLAQRPLWRKYYTRINYDYVIYCIDATKWLAADNKRKETVLQDDRMELHALLNEEELYQCQFIVLINMKRGSEQIADKETTKAAAEIEEELELTGLKKEKCSVVYTFEDLQTRLGVVDKSLTKGCLCD